LKKDTKKDKKSTPKKTIKTNKKQPQKKKKNNKKRRKIVAIIGLIIVLGIISILILLSDLFNIKKITVTNNYKVSTQEIIKNSGLVEGNNMFKTLKTTSKNGIKSNPYIEDVKIHKKLNGEIFIEVTERTATYILQRETDYIYINNQGYILEISQTPLQLPIINGYATTDFILGERLIIEDLEKLDVIIQIMETAKNNGVNNIITVIDISDASNYILGIPSEGKTVHFGNEKNINVKILWIVDLINREKGIEGEIVLNVPDIKKVYFREKV